MMLMYSVQYVGTSMAGVWLYIMIWWYSIYYDCSIEISPILKRLFFVHAHA